MEDNNVQAENSNQAEEVTLDVTEETAPEENAEESVAELKAKLEKVTADKESLKVRAERAERQAKQAVKAEVKPEAQKVSMSNHDFLALVNAKIHEDDIVEVEDYAKFKGISIAEALKISTVKTLLAEKEEMRKVANATNTGNARRSSTKPSSDTVLSNARSGKETDPEAVAEARMAERLKNRKN